MTEVRGFLTTVATEPSKVTGVTIRAPKLRISSTGLTTPDPEPVQWDRDTGEVSFTAEPGSAVLVLQYLSRSESVQLSIPDLPTATLDQVADGIDREYPPAVVSAAQQARNEAVQAADRVGSAERVLEAEASASHDASRAESAAARAESAAQSTTMIETPPGSGLWTIHSQTMAIVESEPNSGLYLIGAS